MHVSSLIAAMLAMAAAAAAVASPVSVAVAPHGAAAALPARVIAVRTDAPRVERRAEIVTSDVATLDLAPGAWEIRAEVEGFTGPPRMVYVTREANITIPLWRAVRVRGKAETKKPAEAIRVAYEPSSGGEAPRGAADCAIVKGAFDCVLPEGTLDLDFHIAGYASVYRWQQRLASGPPFDAGTMKFREGASLVGNVILPRGAAERNVPTVVTLRPVTLTHATGKDPGAAVLERKVTANAKGFFQFTDLPPGQFHVSAQRGRAVSLPVDVAIIAGLEARLRDPLLLAYPRTIAVRIDPPRAPSGAPWALRLTAEDRRAHRYEVVRHGRATADGRWEVEDIPSGEYTIVVGEGKNGWAMRELSIGEDDVELTIPVPLARVAGRLTVGGQPVAGTIYFGGSDDILSVARNTRDDGTFRLILPRPANDVWRRIDVAVDALKVRRELVDVRLTPTGDEGTYRLDLDLPGGFITGVVRDEADAPVAGASVFVRRTDGKEAVVQLTSDPIGGFDLNGLEKGEYVLRAMRHGAQSDPVSVTLSDEPATVRLVVRRTLRVAGIVRSAYGPVYGARIWLYPSDGRAFVIVPVTSAADGRFEFELPPTPRVHVAVQAPGFAFRMFSVPAEVAGELVIDVHQRGGSLAVEGSDEPYVIRRGDTTATSYLMANATGATFAEGWTFPNLEEGAYEICAGAKCVSAYVLAGQTVRVGLGARSQVAGRRSQ